VEDWPEPRTELREPALEDAYAIGERFALDIAASEMASAAALVEGRAPVQDPAVVERRHHAGIEADADLASFIGLEWHGFETTQSIYSDSELGGYRYTLRSFENGYLLRVTTQDQGVFITTDGLTLQDYESVATALRELPGSWERHGPPSEPTGEA
jgi:hypothetical protein